MNTADRLAAYLAGDLDPAETSAIEEELARDPALRAQLSAMRRADGALLALRSPEPLEGFEDRLRAALDPVVAEEIGVAAHDTGERPTGTFDELAGRRARHQERARNRWMPALAGVAAAAAAVLVITNVDFGAGDSADVADMAEDGDAGMETFATPDSAESFDDEAATEEAGPPAPAGPTVVASDREFDDDAIEDLLHAMEIQGVISQHYVGDVGDAVAEDWSRSLVASGQAFALADDDGDMDTAAEEEQRTADPPLLEGGSRALMPEDLADVARCLEHVTAGGPSAIPAYVEVGTYDGTDVVLFGFVTEDPSTGAFTRTELWVVDRSDCEPRVLRQE